MKSLFEGMLLVVLVFGLIFLSSAGSMAAGPAVAVETPRVVLDKNAKVVMKGSGFTPGQEVNVLLTTADGVQSDIGFALDPEPKADSSGAWSTTFDCSDFVTKKLIKEGTYEILVTDMDYNPLAKGSVSFIKGEKKEKK